MGYYLQSKNPEIKMSILGTEIIGNVIKPFFFFPPLSSGLVHEEGGRMQNFPTLGVYITEMFCQKVLEKNLFI